MQKIKSATNSPNCVILDNCGVEPQANRACRSAIYEEKVKCRLLYGNVARPALRQRLPVHRVARHSPTQRLLSVQHSSAPQRAQGQTSVPYVACIWLPFE